jgi:hypothetical protein
VSRDIVRKAIPMTSMLPLHRRARTWYGVRSRPDEPLRHLPPAPAPPRATTIPMLRIAALPPQLRKAPVDRRLTEFL